MATRMGNRRFLGVALSYWWITFIINMVGWLLAGGSLVWGGLVFFHAHPAPRLENLMLPVILTFVNALRGNDAVRRALRPAPTVVVRTPEQAQQHDQLQAYLAHRGLLGLLVSRGLPDDKKLLGLSWRKRWQGVIYNTGWTLLALGALFWLTLLFGGISPLLGSALVAWVVPLAALVGFAGWRFFPSVWFGAQPETPRPAAGTEREPG